MLVMILILCLKPINNVLTSIEVNNYEYHEIKLQFFRFWAKLPPEISLVTRGCLKMGQILKFAINGCHHQISHAILHKNANFQSPVMILS